jgi:hypothetical protein
MRQGSDSGQSSRPFLDHCNKHICPRDICYQRRGQMSFVQLVKMSPPCRLAAGFHSLTPHLSLREKCRTPLPSRIWSHFVPRYRP